MSGGLSYVKGINFTEGNKEAMATMKLIAKSQARLWVIRVQGDSQRLPSILSMFLNPARGPVLVFGFSLVSIF